MGKKQHKRGTAMSLGEFQAKVGGDEDEIAAQLPSGPKADAGGYGARRERFGEGGGDKPRFETRERQDAPATRADQDSSWRTSGPPSATAPRSDSDRTDRPSGDRYGDRDDRPSYPDRRPSGDRYGGDGDRFGGSDRPDRSGGDRFAGSGDRFSGSGDRPPQGRWGSGGGGGERSAAASGGERPRLQLQPRSVPRSDA
eukprot:TRINITY_DN14228_c0_g1_i1.p2 TRINITY_DN14228_c0_g1~~TRINITY_DN14228_c0_g1_i1.p2  ORF type:complete len:219 (-),score=23.60 TRINITY_DN14228_c0_g1_i1:87-680(-)